MDKNPTTGDDLSHLAGPGIVTQEDELINMASSFAQCVMTAYNIPCDFAGLSLQVLRDPDSHKLEAIVITPVDLLSDKPIARFDPIKRVREVPKPKLVLAG